MSNHRLLIIDDSITIRAIISRLLEGGKGIRVVGVARSAEEAEHLIAELHPDVLTLDIALPGMDGLTFLANQMRVDPMPVVVVSGACQPDSDISARALALGASSCFDKATIVSNARALVRAITQARIGKAVAA